MGRPLVLAGLLLLPHAACINYFKGLNTVADLEATGILEKGEHMCPSHHGGQRVDGMPHLVLFIPAPASPCVEPKKVHGAS